MEAFSLSRLIFSIFFIGYTKAVWTGHSSLCLKRQYSGGTHRRNTSRSNSVSAGSWPTWAKNQILGLLKNYKALTHSVESIVAADKVKM